MSTVSRSQTLIRHRPCGIAEDPLISACSGVCRLVLSLALIGAWCGSAGQSLPVEAPVDRLTLTLEQGLQLAVRQNLNLRAQREALAASGYLAAAELAAFRPELVVSGEAGSTQRQNTIEQILSQNAPIFLEDSRSASAAVEGLVPWTGARYRVGYSLRHSENNLRLQPLDPLREEYQNFFGVNIQQPLLKDRGRSATMARARIAAGEEEIAFQDYRQLLAEVLFQVEAAYWELYLAQETLRLRTASRDNAEMLLTDNRERVKAGKMSELEVLQARAGVSLRESQMGQAVQKLVESSNRMKGLLANVGAAPGILLHAADQPRLSHAKGDFTHDIAAAFTSQPAYLARVKRIEQQQTRVEHARNQRRPRLDLTASYGYNGLDSGISGAFRRIEDRDYPSWTVGLEFRIPFPGDARGTRELAAARARLREAEYQLRMLEVEVTNAVHGVHQKVGNLARVMANLEVVVDFNEQLLATEVSRLEEGLSDSRRLLEVESDLADARIAYLESRTAYQIAAVELELVTGRLLENRRMDIAGKAALLESGD
jgi:outer membrane protein